jgi:hypothetical protein
MGASRATSAHRWSGGPENGALTFKVSAGCVFNGIILVYQPYLLTYRFALVFDYRGPLLEPSS